MSEYQAVYDAVRSRLSNCDIGAAVESAANLQFGGASYLWAHAQQEIYSVSYAMQRPSVLYRPQLMADGTMWCALYGENLTVGVAGFGDTPEKAMEAFDKAWREERTPAVHVAARARGETP